MSRAPFYLAAHYHRLGLAPPVTRTQIANAYRVAALKLHPDKGGSAPAFADLTESYNKLLLHHQHPYNYRPASLHSHINARANERSPLLGIATAIVLPAIIGVAVGIRLLFFGRERDGLRAGGTSRFQTDKTARPS